MADRRPDSANSRAKRQKMNTPAVDPKDNPYLAHMYADETSNGNAAFANLKRHQTTAAQAKGVEDGEINPFTGRGFSEKYFSILKTRRDLPVHAQR